MVARAAALAALRAVLLGHPFDTVTVRGVTDGGDDGFLLEVRSGQRRRTHLVAIPADEVSLDTDHMTDDRLPADAGADEWAMWTRLWLMVEFDTGLLRWGARRRLNDGTLVIDPSVPVAHAPHPWSLSTVPLTRPTAEACRELRRRLPPWGSRRSVAVVAGELEEEPDPTPGTSLAGAGLDPSAGRRAHREGRLVVWFQVSDDDEATARVIGQAVASWEDRSAGTARIDHVEMLDGTPPGAVHDLVAAVAHACADAGARGVVASVTVDGLDEVGFGPPDAHGRRWLDASSLP